MKASVFQLAAYVILAASDVSGSDVKLRVFGPHTNDSFVNICPDDDYMFVVECIVTESASFYWTLYPLLQNPLSFSTFNILGETHKGGVIIILTRKVVEQTNEDLSNYISQVQLHTDLIRQTVVDNGEIEVSCGASSNTASLFLDIQVGGSVVIKDARISANILFVKWSTNVSDIEKFAVAAINAERSGVIINESVSKDKRNFSLPVEPAGSYEIIVTASDHCGQHFTSERALVVHEDGTADRPFSLQPTATVLYPTIADSAGYCTCTYPSPRPTLQPVCVNKMQENGAGNYERQCIKYSVVAIQEFV
jgi:hypothetical protein